MKRILNAVIALTVLSGFQAYAQYRDDIAPADTVSSKLNLSLVDSSAAPTVISLDKALEIALSENVSVQVAEKEIKRTEYAKKGTYAALFPQINGTGSYSRTLIRNDIRAMMGDSDLTNAMSNTKIGSLNSFSFGANAALPIVNAQLWESVKISGLGVETAVEKARASKLDMVTQVRKAYYAVLLAKEAFNVYRSVYENAVANFDKIEKKYQAQKASEMEYLRAKTTVSNAIPNVYNAESNVVLALWQLKAVMGIDLEENIDTEGSLDDYTEHLFRDIHEKDSLDLTNNTTLRQFSLQEEQLRRNWRLQSFAFIPTLSASINITYSAVANDPIKKLGWFPYSTVGLSLSIPICSGGRNFNNARAAKNQYEQMQLQRADTERNLRIAARNYLVTMETSMKSYYSAKDALASAQTSYDIVAKSYELGRSTLTDLNDAQLALTQSNLSLSQAVYNFIVAKAQLEQMLGEGLEEVEAASETSEK